MAEHEKSEEKTLDPLRPSDLMRVRRPELFSDSSSLVVPEIKREVFEYHLSTLTSRKQELQFEHFCRKLLEKEICPNLLPQTGPTGGGDSKVDSETYPVADDLAERWYEGIGRKASQERWAFAFSAKRNWVDKIRSDVKGIIAVNRDYKLIFFVTNQSVPDRKRAAEEDALSKTHNVQVRLFDRNWIVSVVFDHKRIQLAIETLGLTAQVKVSTASGPNDMRREGELVELDTQITDPERYRGVDYQLAEDCLQTALLARGLERPRHDVEGRFARAKQIAENVGNSPQRLRIAYNHAWTSFWWYDDFAALDRLYDDVEKLALDSPLVTDIELLTNLWLLLKGAISSGNLNASAVKIEARTNTLKSELDRLTGQIDRPATALEAKSNRLVVDLLEAAQEHDQNKLNVALTGLKEILHDVENLVNFPVVRFTNLIEELGKVLVDNAAYDELFETVVRLLGRRTSEGVVGESLLERGIQKFTGGKRYEAIRLFGRAQQKLALREYRIAHIAAVAGCALAYESAGLLWAARANMLVATNQALQPFLEGGQITFQVLRCFQQLISLELQLGRIPSVLAFMDAVGVVAGALNLGGKRKERFLEQQQMQDRIFGMLFLKATLPQLKTLSFMPGVLEKMSMPHAHLALVYALGYEDHLRDEEWIPKEETTDDIKKFFWGWLNQPAKDDLPKVPNLSLPPTVTLHTIVLGCEIVAECADNLLSIQIGETILGAVEALLATSLDARVVPHCSHFSIRVRPAENSSGDKLQSELVEIEGETILIVLHPADMSAEKRSSNRSNWLIDIFAKVLTSIAVIRDPEVYFDRLAEEEAGFGRIIDFNVLTNCVKNILGNKPRQFLSDWKPVDETMPAFPLKRTEIWSVGLNVESQQEDQRKPSAFRAGRGDPPVELLDTDKMRHRDQRVMSLIDVPLWDRARWHGTLYIYAADLSAPPGLALGFENEEAAKAIFSRWRKLLGDADIDEQIRITILTGIDKDNPAHYKVVVGTKPPEPRNVALADQRIVMVSRINRMAPVNSTNLDLFVKRVERTQEFFLLPAYFKDSNTLPKVFGEYAIRKKKIFVRPMWQIDENDPDIFGLSHDDVPIIPANVKDPPVLRAMKQNARFTKK